MGQAKKIKIFSNLLDQQQKEDAQSLALSIEQRIALTVQLIKKIYQHTQHNKATRINILKGA